MAEYEVNGQVYKFPDDMPETTALSIISAQDPNSLKSPELDTSKPYAGAYKPYVQGTEEVTTETSTSGMGDPIGMTFTNTETRPKLVDPKDLANDSDFLQATAKVYKAIEKKPFTGTAEELADYGYSTGQEFNLNTPMAVRRAIQISGLPEDQKQAYVYVLDRYKSTGSSPAGLARGAGYLAADPMNWLDVALVALSGGAATPEVAAKQAAARTALQKMIGGVVLETTTNALQGSIQNVADQAVEIEARRQRNIDPLEVAQAAGESGLVGLVLSGGAAVTGHLLRGEAKALPQPGDPNFVGPVAPPRPGAPDFIGPMEPYGPSLPKPGTPEFVGPVHAFEPGDPRFIGPTRPIGPPEAQGPKLPDETNPNFIGPRSEGAQIGPQLPKEGDPNFIGPSRAQEVVASPEASKVVSETPRILSLVDDIEGRSIAESAARNAAEPPASNVSTRVRELLDRVPDFSQYTFSYVKQIIKPIMDEFLAIAKEGPEELDRALSYKLIEPDRNKLMAVVTSAASRIEQDLKEVSAQLVEAKAAKITDANKIEGLALKQKDLLDTLENVQRLQTPLGSEAGRLLKLAQIEKALNVTNRVDVAALRASGVSADDIAKMIADATDLVSKKELNELLVARKAAKAAGNWVEVQKIDAKLDTALEKVRKAAEAAQDSILKKAIGVLSEAYVSSLISSTGTAIRTFVGAPLVKLQDRVSEIAGLVLTTKNGFMTYAAQRAARDLTFKAGYESMLQTIGQVLKKSAIETAGERSMVNLPVRGELSYRKMSSTYLGFDPNSKLGKITDWVGWLWKSQTWPLTFNDEFLGNIFARQELGDRAGFDFVQRIQQARDTLNAQLRDPNLTPEKKAELKAGLKELKSLKTAKVDGMSLEEFVQKRISENIDEYGRVLNPDANEQAAYLLLRNAPTSEFGRGVEQVINAGGGVGRFIFPFIRNPINSFKRAAESLPILQSIPGIQDLSRDLASGDPRKAARARGKYITGWLITSFAYYWAKQGNSTGSEPLNNDDRLMNQASSLMAPKSMSIPGLGPVDISGLDPISGVFITMANVAQMEEHMGRVIDNLVAIGNHEEAAKKISELEQYSKKAVAVGMAYAAGFAMAVKDMGTLEPVRSLVSALDTAAKSGDDNETLARNAQRGANRFGVAIIPALIKEWRNLSDPSIVNPHGFMETLKASLGFKESQALVRDFMGYPIMAKTPNRSIGGPFARENLPKQDNVAQVVRDEFETIRQTTGKSFILGTSPPGYKQLDISNIRAVSGQRSVFDVYGDQLMTVKVRGKTLAEVLHEMVGNREKFHRSLGNSEYQGKFFTDVQSVLNDFKDAAWATTLKLEKDNLDLSVELKNRDALKKSSMNPALDIAPPSIPLHFNKD